MNRIEYFEKSLYAGALIYTGNDLPLFTPAAAEKSKPVIELFANDCKLNK